eukprot:699355-Pleurochrysis_carterae.AAC.1
MANARHTRPFLRVGRVRAGVLDYQSIDPGSGKPMLWTWANSRNILWNFGSGDARTKPVRKFVSRSPSRFASPSAFFDVYLLCPASLLGVTIGVVV